MILNYSSSSLPVFNPEGGRHEGNQVGELFAAARPRGEQHHGDHRLLGCALKDHFQFPFVFFIREPIQRLFSVSL